MFQPKHGLAVAFSKRTVAIIIAALALAYILAVCFLIDIARMQDARSVAQTDSFVRFAIGEQQSALARNAIDYADWGDAYQHLHLKVDPQWAYNEDNFGPSLAKQLGIEYAAVFDSDDHEVYSVVDSVLMDKPAVGSALRGGLGGLIAEARTKAGTVAKGILISGERPVLAVARVISPGQNTAVKLDNRKPSVTILGGVLTEAKIDQLRKALNLKSLRFSLSSAKPGTEDVIFRTVDGTTSFVAEFESATVGSELLRAVIPSFVVVAAAFGAFFVFLARHGVRKAEVTSQSHRHLEKQALYDAVTGLPNRLFFTRRLIETPKMSAAPPAVLFLDLDRFKPVNDLLGHAAGDCVLREVARRIQSCIEPQDLCARLGGDEFAIIVPRQDDVAVRRLCKRIIHSVSATIIYASNQISVGVSIGVTRVGGPDDALEDVLRRADKALYAAKAAGRQTFRWYEEPHSDARVSA